MRISCRHNTNSRRALRLTLAALLAVLPPVFLLTLAAIGQNGKKAPGIPREDMQACLACHSEEMAGKHPVKADLLAASPHKDLKCQDCHATITAAPHTPEMLKEKAACATCHSDEHTLYSQSVHSHKDKLAGDHPTCVSCHSRTKTDPHAIKPMKEWARTEKAALCSNCHAQQGRMGRYGVDPDAVASYNESFHGKALNKFGMTKTAVCNDCHRNHDVLAPTDPRAPTNRANAGHLCSQPGCHAGATVNFAMSGANHLRLKVKKVPLLRYEEIFFRTLTGGTILFLLGGVALDLRKRVFANPPPPSGRPVAIFISISFLLVVAALAMALFGVKGADWTGAAAALLLVLAFVIYYLSPHRAKRNGNGQKKYPRFSLAQRVQHIVLMVTFIILVLTGIPLRFANVDWLQNITRIFGGFSTARIFHRVAATTMIVDWIWHTLFLIHKWKQDGFKLSALTMIPNLKDVKDFIQVSLFYLGLSKHEPKYDRFQFREKFDYFAVYWGMPIMVFSGLVLWFPIYFGNRLPEIGLSFAYIAHSDESVLAFLVIAVWHMYNVHFCPDKFPMNRVFYTGDLTEQEMQNEHPVELARLKSQEQS